jgi:hypothetical protein
LLFSALGRNQNTVSLNVSCGKHELEYEEKDSIGSYIISVGYSCQDDRPAIGGKSKCATRLTLHPTFNCMGKAVILPVSRPRMADMEKLMGVSFQSLLLIHHKTNQQLPVERDLT